MKIHFRSAYIYIPLLFMSMGLHAATNESLGKVTIEGNDHIEDRRLQEILPLTRGSVLTEKNKTLAQEVIRSLYRSRGFFDVTVGLSTVEEEEAITLVLVIQEGDQYLFGEFRVVGLESLPSFVVEREKTFVKGDAFDQRDLYKTQRHLYLTGLFDDIRIHTSTTTQKTIDVNITLVERNLVWAKGGIGWGSEEKERFSLQLTHDNLLSRAYKLDLLGTISRIWLEYRLDFTNRYFFGTRTEQQTSVSWRNEDREGHDFEQIRGDFGLGRNLGYQVKGKVGFQYKRTQTFNVDPDITSLAPDTSESRSVSLGLNRDQSNDPFYPSQGTRTALTLERLGGVLGGDFDINKAFFNASVYQQLVGPFIGAFTFRSAVSKEFSPTKDVPIFERLFMGGANSVRGYRERGVGRKDRAGSPLGGKWLLGSSVEVRFPLFWKFTGAAFIDGGQVDEQASQVSLSKWKYGGGGGIRLKTPVGPLRLDYGYKMNRDRHDVNPWRIHFSLGESF